MRSARKLCAGVATLALVSCGGGGGSHAISSGGGSSSTGGSTIGAPAITLQLTNSAGAASNQVSTSSPLTAKATLVDASGTPVSNTLVSFSTGQNFTTISPLSAQVLTNASGVATVTLSVASLAIAQTQGGSGDVLTAQAAVDSTVAKGAAPFSIGATQVALSLAAPASGTVNVPAYSSTLIKVNVLANGAPYTSTPVSVDFQSACATSGKASMPATATTVNGQAVVTYTDKGCSSTDAVTITLAGATPITASMVDAAPTAASVEFVSATPAGEAIVIQGAGGNGRVETATLTFEALDTFGNPLPNETVNFSLNTSQPVTLGATAGVTDANGKVTVSVSSGTVPTTFRVIATLPSGQSTISDGITVTTGQPVQAAFSLSVGTPNIEGWQYDNTQTNVNILLADQNGNPVADGTPVVFQTDSGAIGSSTNGGCVTTNGGCSVTFRSQNPRYGLNNSAGKRPGVATVSVSTTSALYTLSGQIHIFLSGSQASNIVAVAPSGISVNSSGAFVLPCGSTTMTLYVGDLNYNPMPKGTTIAVAAALDPTNTSSAQILNFFPTQVAAESPETLIGSAVNPGTTHTLVFTPGGGAGAKNQCGSVGSGTNSGTLLITVTSPLGVVTTPQYPINFTYPK